MNFNTYLYILYIYIYSKLFTPVLLMYKTIPQAVVVLCWFQKQKYYCDFVQNYILCQIKRAFTKKLILTKF